MSYTKAVMPCPARQSSHGWDAVLLSDAFPLTLCESRLDRQSLQDFDRHVFSKTSLKRTGRLCLDASSRRAEFEPIPGGLALSGFARHFSNGSLLKTTLGKEPPPAVYPSHCPTSQAYSTKKRDASNKSEGSPLLDAAACIPPASCPYEHDLFLPPLPVGKLNLGFQEGLSDATLETALKPVAASLGPDMAEIVHQEKASQASASATIAAFLRASQVRSASLQSSVRLPCLQHVKPEVDTPISSKTCLPALRKTCDGLLHGSQQKRQVRFSLQLNEEWQYTMQQSL